MGHAACGALKGACDDAKLGNLTSMLENIKPAISAVAEPADISLRNSSNASFVNNVAVANVKLSIDRILAESEVLNDKQKNNEIVILGAMYDVNTGKVSFME